jgi:hypothetical protein
MERPLATKLVYCPSMSDICVVDFPSLLLIPMLQRIARHYSSAICKQ